MSDAGGHFCCLNLCDSHTLENVARINYDVLHINWRAHVACNFNCLIKTETGNISETMQEGDIVMTDH